MRNKMPSAVMKPAVQPMPSASTPMMPPPKTSAPESKWSIFKKWLKDTKIISGSLGHLSRLEILNKYKNALLALKAGSEAVGYGKKKKRYGMIKNHDKLIKSIQQAGGSWGDFTNWIRNRANDVASAGRAIGNKIASAGKTVYNKAIRPAYNYVKDKPVSSLGYLAKGLSYIPSPLSGALSTAGTVLGTAGTLSGKGQNGGCGTCGQKGGARYSHQGKILAVF